MTNTSLVSTASSAMLDYPLVMQAAGGETAFGTATYTPDGDGNIVMPLGIPYSAKDFRLMYDAIFPTAGPLSGFQVTQHGSGDANLVDISPGNIVLPGGSAGGKYLTALTSSVAMTIPPKPSVGTVYHRLVAQVLDKADGGDGSYGWTFIGLEGTGASAPATPGNAVSLAVIKRSSTQTNMLTADIDQSAMSSAAPYTPKLVGGTLYPGTGAWAAGGAATSEPGFSLNMYASSIPVVAGHRYKIEVTAEVATTTSMELIFLILQDNSSGLKISSYHEHYTVADAGLPGKRYPVQFSGEWTCPTNVTSKTFAVTAYRAADTGSGTFTAYQGQSRIAVYDVGLASVLVTAS